MITATEGAALHLDRLRTRPAAFDPAVRDRLLAGALVPAALVTQAQKLRRRFRADVLALFGTVDVILAPATPCSAPLLGQQDFELDGVSAAGARQPGRVHPADQLHRPAGRGRAGARAGPAGRRAGDRRPVAGGRGAARRPLHWNGTACAPPGNRRDGTDMEINLPDVVAEVAAAFARYEAALTGNDVATLDAAFWDSAAVIRYGIGGEPVWRRRDRRLPRRPAVAGPDALALPHRDHHASAATSPPPPPCSTARRRRAGSAARCRAGCACRKAGGWWRRMSA